ncbi:ImmA/IrrE family metallo-endopeptidase [Alkalinema sp. FACHB-956]|uniref:ImmA/IrrE family metallo-endopeptidase n=1 Tax=Alkalinema sp. FACHB-956 TaxID=2692768 RepID=UPI001682C3DC|nr:ImmA/IrrE family metallo-endopeptidase [Alkalinema sp. FACHB-956]MBD2327247.1 ImmA/IrrE family metallo-endopeptidase [Alkalinema sp. FACHB-956]
MTQVQIKMADLYDRLVNVGFSRKYIRQVGLPDWWTDEADQDPDVLLEGAAYLANRLNVNLRSLLTENSEVSFASAFQLKFKLKNGTDTNRLTIPRALASRVAEVVAYGCKQPYLGLANWSIDRIRQQIMQSQDAVDLLGLVQFCWSIGIPVLHFSAFPPDVHRFQGMVAYFVDRPVIIVSLKDKSPARLLFIAAHELGHLLCGHVRQDEPLVDERVAVATDDADEDEANQVAQELLIGRSAMSYDIWRRYITGEQLAQESLRLAKKDHVAPGVVALNIAWNRAGRAYTKADKEMIWRIGIKALKTLEPAVHAPHLINQILCQHLDWSQLNDETIDYLVTMLDLDRQWFE